jgi:GDP-L-fucose synthase
MDSDAGKKKLSGARILVTGASGFLGQYVVHELKAQGAETFPVSRKFGFDLRNEAESLMAMLEIHPDIVVHLAAKAGGIGANLVAPATFFRENMLMGINVVHAAAVARAALIMVGDATSYPRECPTPFREESFWTGFPEPAAAPYAIAKKALLVMCQAYRKQHGLRYAFLAPTNMYGPLDHFEEGTSRVIPALIRRFIEAQEENRAEVVCWGTGKALRSFLFAVDAARAIAASVGVDHDDVVNLPGGPEVSVADLAALVARSCGYNGRIKWDPTKPEGQLRRVVDGAKAKKLLGWSPTTSLEDGIRATVDWWLTEGRKP